MDGITNEIMLDRLASECDVIFHLAATVGIKLILEHRPHHRNQHYGHRGCIKGGVALSNQGDDRLYLGSIWQGHSTPLPRRR